MDNLTRRPLGSTKLFCHPLGFGCYRVAGGVAEHELALQRYLDQGGNLIDTSANYTDGQSEILVGKVLKEYPRENVVVVTKAGYMQGKNLALAQSRSFPDVVKYGEGIWHCIHPQFLETQLDQSCERMQLEVIDFFLLHNPEYYLSHQAHHHTLTADDHHEFYRRVGEAFRFLEQKAQEGRIRWYGISSNNYGFPLSDPARTSVQKCLEQAREIAWDHHFRLVQLPLNLYESGGALIPNNDGETVLEFCSQNGLGVLVNRPLNAFHNNMLVRLADFGHSGGELEIRTLDSIVQPIQELEADFQEKWNKPLLGGPLQGLSDLLKQIVPQVRSADHWDPIVERYVAPPLQSWLQHCSASYSDQPAWVRWRDSYFKAIHSAFEEIERLLYVRNQETSNQVRRRLEQSGYPPSSRPLSQIALGLLLKLKGISSVLVGMRKRRYVDDSLASLATPDLDAMAVLRNFSAPTKADSVL